MTLPRAAMQRLIERERGRASSVTAEQMAAGHVPQLELTTAEERRVIALCSRRAAKSTGICDLMALDAETNTGVQLYFGATKPAVRLSIWENIWKPRCKKFGFHVSHNETMMVSRFASGALVAFTGTDDVRHVETYLGNKLRRAVIDEAQSQAQSLLVPLVTRILPPALSPAKSSTGALLGKGGQFLLAGTIPEVPAGLFYEYWMRAQGWRKFNWSRFENPHMGTREEQMAELLELLASTPGLTIDDPMIRRDWFGEFVFDPTATAYRYQVALNGYDAEAPEWLAELFATGLKFCHPTKDDGKCRYGVKAAKPHPGITRFSAAIDPGTSDRATLQITGWGDETHEVQHVFEWSTPRKAGATWDDIAGVAGFVNGKLEIEAWRYDGGGSNMEIDTFGNDYGLPVIKAAAKADMRGQIARENTLFQKGWSKIMKGSALEEDYRKARLDPDAIARGQLKWSSQWHPDPSEAKRYADQGYYDAYQAPEAQRDVGAQLAYAARHRNDEEDDDPLGLMDDDD